MGEQAVFGFGDSRGAIGSVFVEVLANGAGETGMVYGRSNASDPWTLLGSLTEPYLGELGTPPNVEVFPLAGTGLPWVNEMKIVSSSNAGTFPGLDIHGLGAANVINTPEPSSFALAILGGLGALIVGIRRRSRVGHAPRG